MSEVLLGVCYDIDVQAMLLKDLRYLILIRFILLSVTPKLGYNIVHTKMVLVTTRFERVSWICIDVFKK